MKPLFIGLALVATLALGVSPARAAVDTEVIVFEIAKDANGSVIGWDQNNWSLAEWNAYGNRASLDRLKEKYGAARSAVKIIHADSHFIVYTKKHKDGKITIGIPSTRNRKAFEADQNRIGAYPENYPGQYTIH